MLVEKTGSFWGTGSLWTRLKTKPVLKTTYKTFLALHGLRHVMLLLPVSSHTTANFDFSPPSKAHIPIASQTLCMHVFTGAFSRGTWG